MKKVMIFAALLYLSSGLIAQSKFEHFWEKVPAFGAEGTRAVTGKWLPRPAFTANALQVPLGGEQPARLVSCFGAGIGYGLFTMQDGEPYQSVAFTLSILVGPSEDKTVSEITPALGITGWEVVNLGVGYNFGIQRAVVLLNLTYSFN